MSGVIAARSPVPVPSTVSAGGPAVLDRDPELEDDSGERTRVSGEGVLESDDDGVFGTQIYQAKDALSRRTL